MANWQPDIPYNELPPPPGVDELETRRVLKAAIGANAALAQLDQAVASISNPTVLINTIPILEAQASSEIENIVTTTDELFRHQIDEAGADPATRETLRYRTALRTGFDLTIQRGLTTATALAVCSTIKARDMRVRALPGTRIANPATGEIIYSPPEGKELIGEMMSRGMLIDAAHMSERSVADALLLTQPNGYYPLYISHGHPREVMGPDQEKNEKTTPAWVMRGLRQSGGIFGLRTFHDETREYDRSEVENTCHGSSRSFAQALGFAVKGLKVAVALGTDFNGFIQQVRPRFGDLGACSAGFRAEGDAQAKAEASSPAARLGTDYDEKGLAHIGLVPDFLRDLERVGASTSSLQDSAEAFLRMWERATSPRTGMADAAADLDTSGVAPYVQKATREAAYPKECGQSYAPASKAPGQSCRFNGECTTSRCSALLCGAVPGRCS